MRLKLLLISMMLWSGVAFAGTASVDNVFVSNDVYASDFHSRLNRNIVQLENSINNIEGSTNVANDTLLERNMADEINPRIRTAEGAACPDFVTTSNGLLPQTTSGTLTGNILAGTGYPDGYRVTKASNTSHSWTASKWTWTDIDTNGDFHYTETAFGAAAPAVFANSMRLARVSSDAAEVNSVLDLRVTSCTNGPFSIISDATGEATLGDLLSYGNGGFAWGMNVASGDATHVTLKTGSMYINGQYRSVVADLSVPVSSVGSSTAGTSGLDAGSVAAGTTYYLYAAADQDGVKAPVGILSTNATNPGGVTNYRKVGEITTDVGSGFTAASSDITTVHYSGKIRQIKKMVTGSVAVGTTAIPLDDTLPSSSEGDLYMSKVFTPSSATNILKIDVVVMMSATANTDRTACLYQDATNALACGSQMSGAATMVNIAFTYFMEAGSAAPMTFKVRAGNGAGATTTFNGGTSARLFGGGLASSLTITEYQP